MIWPHDSIFLASSVFERLIGFSRLAIASKQNQSIISRRWLLLIHKHVHLTLAEFGRCVTPTNFPQKQLEPGEEEL